MSQLKTEVLSRHPDTYRCIERCSTSVSSKKIQISHTMRLSEAIMKQTETGSGGTPFNPALGRQR